MPFSPRASALAALALLLSGCLGPDRPSPVAGQADVDYDLILNPRATPVTWDKDVRPVIEGRCVVCHACYDAPCQLKLSSYEGLMRGANPQKVYDGARILEAAPTRLFVDAKSPEEWWTKGFHPVLTRSAADPEQALSQSLLYRMLRLKELNPQPRTGMLPDSVTLDLDRKQACTTEPDFDKFAKDNPLWGMPYGMPNLSERDYRVLVQWLAAGAPPPPVARTSPEAARQIAAWEGFLNGGSLREQLMSRYIYEHLFVGHIWFAEGPPREFFRLVRSYTPPGEPIDEVATIRPYDDPGRRFWYRLRPDHQSVVAKDHIPYQWSATRLARYRELFLAPDYVVTELPSYQRETASNPLLTFAALPVDSRYRFLLDDARFFIEGFIKGPVCRGQVALNVIDDRFWVFFLSPDRPRRPDRDQFIAEMAGYLRLPADRGDTLDVLKLRTEYWAGQKTYLLAKQAWFEQIHAVGLDDAMSHIWNGGGTNPNAALTIFRHTDSAFVVDGLWGDNPETAWIMDYPVFERIHYLLVAGFDVYGNVGHQLLTRIVMDFMRMESENNFLAFLPANRRKEIRDSWYQGIRKKREKQFEEPTDWLTVESVIGYQTNDPLRELYGHLRRRVGKLAGPNRLNGCDAGGCASDGATAQAARDRAEAALRRIAQQKGRQLLPLPDAAFLRVRTGGPPAGDLAYTLIVNKDYADLTWLMEDEDKRNPDNDTLTVMPGYAASYPNFFLEVDLDEVEAFADRFVAIDDRDDYERFVALYGMRRTNPDFWRESDWHQATYRQLEPVHAGIFDLNRYRNR